MFQFKYNIMSEKAEYCEAIAAFFILKVNLGALFRIIRNPDIALFPPQLGAHPLQELIHPERLADIVLATCLKGFLHHLIRPCW